VLSFKDFLQASSEDAPSFYLRECWIDAPRARNVALASSFFEHYEDFELGPTLNTIVLRKCQTKREFAVQL